MTNTTRRRLPRYNGPASYTSHQRYWYCRVLAAFPHAYSTLGVGWCGPGFQVVEQLMSRIAAGENFGPELWSTPLPVVAEAA
jgi:hypothetical protein